MDDASRPPGKRDRTRGALIETARRVVEEKGFQGASLDEIAARAGMTKGAIYSNFGGKADLMLAVARTLSISLSPSISPDQPLDRQLAAVAEAVIAMLPKAADRARLEFEFQLYVLQEPSLREPVAEAYQEALGALVEKAHAQHGGALAIAPQTLVVAAQALAVGFAHQYRLTPALVTPAVVREAFAALAAGAAKTRF
jgi:AcrR family transcriptional regulator